MRKRHYTQIGKEMDWHPLEQGVFGDARKIKIAVVGIGREAGASFVAANLAYHLAKHVDGITYMEAEDAQIAETLEGRRYACYSLGLERALGLERLSERDRPPEPDRKRKRDCGRALGLKHPTESARDQTHTADRNRESARPRDHDRQHASEWPAECGCLPEHERDCERSHASGRNREPDRSNEYDRKCKCDRSPETFSVRIAKGKFIDYFALEKEGLPAGSRRNLYANVNWAVRAPLGAAPLEAVPFGNSALETSALSETCSESKRHARFRTPRPAASEPCMLAATQGIGRIPGHYMIVDNPRPESLWEADLVICVVDPLPSRIRSEIRQLEALRDNQICFGKRFSPLLNLPTSVLWVLNKDNPQAGHRELERSLNIKFDFAVPLFSPEIFYKAEYSSVPIFQMLEAAACSEFGRLAKSVLKLLD